VTVALQPLRKDQHGVSLIDTGETRMLIILKIIHFLAFSLAVGASLANVVAGKRLAALMPEAAATVMPLRAKRGQIATVGWILLWITGLWLAWAKYDSSLWSYCWFLVKMALLLSLTACSAMLNLATIKANRGGPPPNPKRMMQLGIAGHAFALSIVIVAVITFR